MATLYWFGVKKLEIAPLPTAPATTPVWTQVPSIESASVSASVTEVKAYGDGVLQYSYTHSPETSLAVKLTKLDTAVAEMLTGNVAAEVTGTTTQYFMTNNDLAQPQVMCRVTVPSVDDATGVNKDMVLIFFKTKARTLWNGLGSERSASTSLEWTFDCVTSTVDEKGDPLPSGVDYATGKIVF